MLNIRNIRSTNQSKRRNLHASERLRRRGTGRRRRVEIFLGVIGQAQIIRADGGFWILGKRLAIGADGRIPFAPLIVLKPFAEEFG